MNKPRKSFWDLRSPALRPLWLRILIVAICAAWTVVELSAGDLFWAIIFGASAAFLYRKLIWKFDQSSDE